MKTTKLNKTISIILIVLGILTTLSSGLFMGYVGEAHEVPCYDKYSNVIQGQTCIENYPFYDDGLMLLFIGMLIVFIGILLYPIDLQYNSLESHAGLY